MCSYCGRDDSGNSLLIQRDEAFGDENALYMDSYLWANGDQPHISVGVCLFDRDIMSARFSVNYCPMCGRKLTAASHAGEWISVKDRLPPEVGAYLVCESDGNIETADYHTATNTHGNFYRYFHGQYEEIADVTHWTELPAPPVD